MRLFTRNTTDAAAFPAQAIFVPFPFVCFTLAFATDIAFWASANLMWQNFSAWLLFAGLVFCGIGLIAGLIDLMRARTRPLRPSLLPIAIYIIVLLLAFLNSLVHAGDGWTAVVPYGLAISAITFVLLLITLALSAHKYSRLAWRV